MENWRNLIHLFVTVFLWNFASLLVNPTITDVTMEAVCPGQDECSLAIYLTGFQQAIGGLGSMVMMPLLGSLSDVYGRKSLFTIPLTLSTIPLLILSLKRSTEFFYAYYILKTVTLMICDGGVICLSLSYMADNVSEGKRVSVFGMFSGVISAATVCGTLAARLLPTAQIFQVAAAASITAAVYMRIFLQEPRRVEEEEPILKPVSNESVVPLLENADLVKKISLPKHMIRLLSSSLTFSLAAFVAFFNSLSEAGIQAFLTYFLKARFHYKKDQFADVWLITFMTGTVSNMLLMPTLGPLLGEETLLCVGLFVGFVNMLLDSIAWAPWVPYASSLLGVFTVLASPSIRCIISKQVGPYEQGIAQGCLLAIISFANVMSPVIFSPLSALFLSDSAPFNFPGFCVLCIGIASLIGFVLAMMIRLAPSLSSRRDEQPNTLA